MFSGTAWLAIGIGLHQAGRHAEALGELVEVADAAGGRAPRALLALASIELQAGDLAASQRWAARLLELCARRRLPLMGGWAHYVLGRVAYEVNALEEAREQFTAILAERHLRHFTVVIEALLGLALTDQALGRPIASERETGGPHGPPVSRFRVAG